MKRSVDKQTVLKDKTLSVRFMNRTVVCDFHGCRKTACHAIRNRLQLETVGHAFKGLEKVRLNPLALGTI